MLVSPAQSAIGVHLLIIAYKSANQNHALDASVDDY